MATTIIEEEIPDEDLYITAQEVSDYLGLNITPSESSDPKLATFNKFIKMAMAEIERRTNRAWRIKRYDQLVKDVSAAWIPTRGVPIYLAHSDMVPFDKDAGDKLEAWNGSEYVDYTTAVSIYYLERFGKIYIRGLSWSWLRDDRLKISYRYRSKLTEDVKEATLKLTSVKLIERNFNIKTMVFSNNINPVDATRQWRQDVDDWVSQEQEWSLIST